MKNWSVERIMAQTPFTWDVYCVATNRYGAKKRLNKLHTRMLIFSIAFGCIIAMAAMILSGAARANASVDYARVVVIWTGTPCIEVEQVTGMRETICGGQGEFTAITGPGKTIGIDPIMGEATQISCSFYLNGSLEFWDHAYAGDGTDVNCIREIYARVPQIGIYT